MSGKKKGPVKFTPAIKHTNGVKPENNVGRPGNPPIQKKTSN